MKRRFLTIALTLALCLSLAVPTFATGGFTDVAPGAYYADAVSWAVENEITNGTSDTTFSPDQSCTVAQIVTFLWRAHGAPKAAAANPFSDVKSGDWFYDAACWAGEKGVVTGGSFRPTAPCTRLMAVRYMWEAADRPDGANAPFTDLDASDFDNRYAVNWAVEWGITTGTSDTTFSPDAVCNRGQIVTLLHRCAENFQPAGTPLTDESQISGTYVLESDGFYTIETELTHNGVNFDLRLTKKGTTRITGGLIVVPGEYGGLGARWNGLEMQFYEGFLVLKVPDSVSSVYEGKYIRQS